MSIKVIESMVFWMWFISLLVYTFVLMYTTFVILVSISIYKSMFSPKYEEIDTTYIPLHKK